MLKYLNIVFHHQYTRITFSYVVPLIVAGGFIFVWIKYFPPDPSFWKEPLAEITRWGGEQTLKITDVKVIGASEVLDTQISLYLTEELRKVNLDSLNLDLNKIRTGINFIPSVTNVELAIEKNGVLKIIVEERIPQILWYDNEQFHLLDKDGLAIDTTTNRDAFPDFFVVAGRGADDKVEEAVDLVAVSEKINHHIRGLVWIGERRWDLVLDRGRLVKLPEKEPIEAMKKLKVLDEKEGLLEREISILDLRIPNKIYVRKYRNIEETEEE